MEEDKVIKDSLTEQILRVEKMALKKELSEEEYKKYEEELAKELDED